MSPSCDQRSSMFSATWITNFRSFVGNENARYCSPLNWTVSKPSLESDINGLSDAAS